MRRFQKRAIPISLRIDHNKGKSSLRLLERISTAPTSVPKGLSRYFVYWRVFYFLAGTTHGMSILYFRDREVWLMAWFNVASVLIFSACLLLLYHGWFRTAYWLAIAELLSHAVAATISVGPELGALDAILLVLILLYVQPFYPLMVSIIMSALVLATAVVTQNYMLTHPPIYPHFQTSAGDLATRVIAWPMLMMAMVVPFIRAASQAEQEVEAAHRESERLLHNILPVTIAERLKGGEQLIADEHARVAIMFVDIVGFTNMSRDQEPAKIVKLLNGLVVAIDDLVAKHEAEKIKTIGDAIMIAVGAPVPQTHPEDNAMQLALEILDIARSFKRPDTSKRIQLRIGLHSGKAVAGVIGKSKFAYDIWGETVNIASRMESLGQPDAIQVSEAFASRLTTDFAFEMQSTVVVAEQSVGTFIYRQQKL